MLFILLLLLTYCCSFLYFRCEAQKIKWWIGYGEREELLVGAGCQAYTWWLMTPLLSWEDWRVTVCMRRGRNRNRDLVYKIPKERCYIRVGFKDLQFRENGDRDRKSDKSIL